MKFTKNAEIILQKRYLLKDSKGNVTETPSQMFRRVAKAIALVDKKFNPVAKVSLTEDKFYKMMSECLFLPNSPTLMNAGTEMGQLSACFVLPIEDSLKDIFESLKNMAIIHQTGGGVGFNFGRLRPANSVVKTTHGIASGPVSFIKIFDAATDVVRQGGRRRGANMGILPVNHPDIREFISAKRNEGTLRNFNLSVSVTDKFMEAAKKGLKYPLKDPKTGKTVIMENAADIFSLIVELAWESGDPGIIFIDRINKANPLPKQGIIEATNPCGEQPLLPFESCNLGSINLSKVVKAGKIDYKLLKDLVHTGVHFLDNVIDANTYPFPEIEKITLANRKIGLGIMGFADLLIKLGIQYNSQKAVAVAEKVMGFISDEAYAASEALGRERGSFPNFKESIFKNKYKSLRNACVTTIAPTGTISIIADCSSGIEPIYAIAFVRTMADGEDILECSELFLEFARKQRFWKEELCKRVLNEGGIAELSEIPEETKKLFITSVQIPFDWHVNVAAAFQKYTDNCVSKTVNLPSSATKEDIKNIFLLAYKQKCKGITVFRSGCKKEQALSIKAEDTGRIAVESEFAGGCPVSYCVD